MTCGYQEYEITFLANGGLALIPLVGKTLGEGKRAKTGQNNLWEPYFSNRHIMLWYTRVKLYYLLDFLKYLSNFNY